MFFCKANLLSLNSALAGACKEIVAQENGKIKRAAEIAQIIDVMDNVDANLLFGIKEGGETG